MNKFLPLNLQYFAADTGIEGGAPDEIKAPIVDEPKDNMIPKTRFDEINSKYKEMVEKMSAIESAESERQKQLEEDKKRQAEEQGKFQELYQTAQKELEGYKVYEERTKALEGVIVGMVETKLTAVPKELHDLVPTNLTSEQTLDWLNKAESKGLFGKKEESPKEIGKPSNHSTDKPKIDKAELSALDKIIAGLGK